MRWTLVAVEHCLLFANYSSGISAQCLWLQCWCVLPQQETFWLSGLFCRLSFVLSVSSGVDIDSLLFRRCCHITISEVELKVHLQDYGNKPYTENGFENGFV